VLPLIQASGGKGPIVVLLFAVALAVVAGHVCLVSVGEPYPAASSESLASTDHHESDDSHSGSCGDAVAKAPPARAYLGAAPMLTSAREEADPRRATRGGCRSAGLTASPASHGCSLFLLNACLLI
jgi:hypothetical protein